MPSSASPTADGLIAVSTYFTTSKQALLSSRSHVLDPQELVGMPVLMGSDRQLGAQSSCPLDYAMRRF